MRTIFILVLCIISRLDAFNLSNFRSINTHETGKAVPKCTEKYGNQPAARTVSLNNILAILNICKNISGPVQVLNFIDSNGDPRRACLLYNVSPKPLPLLVWLHPSIFPASTIVLTNFLDESNEADLTGNPNGPRGYHLLLPFGRNTSHIYPAPADNGLGWDN